MAQHNELGSWGERKAAEYLLSQGFEILETNWRYGRAEIDIIAREGDTLVVVEVKTRHTDLFGEPQNAVGKKKIRLLMEAVNAYVDQKKIDSEIRFDIVSIIKNQYREEIEHLRDAFYWF
ncbi:MAG: YraN family protein [Chlorobi bacterium]|nr:YraN family protein [Chlorobiota bacterium]